MKLNVLIADNENPIVESYSKLVKIISNELKIEINIYTANSASQTFDIIDNEIIDIFFLDYEFKGGLSGTEIIKELDKDDPFRDYYYVIISGEDKNDLESGFCEIQLKMKIKNFYFLDKPIDKLDLKTKIISIVRNINEKPLPLPLDYPLSLLSTSSNSFKQFSVLNDLMELSTKFFAWVFMSKANQLNLLTNLNVYHFPNLTGFGSFIKILENMINFIQKSNKLTNIEDILQYFNSERLKFIWDFKNSYRDKEIGHKGITSDELFYKHIVDNYKDKVISFYKNLYFMNKFRLIVPISIKKLNKKSVIYEIKVLMGKNISFESIELELNDSIKLDNEKVYLLNNLKEPIELYPLCLYKLCINCEQPRLYMLDSRVKSTLVYKAFTCKHSIEEAIPNEFKNTIFLASQKKCD